LKRCDNVIQITFHDHDVASFHRNVCSASHRDSHIRLSQCRRIIDTISNHGNFFAECLNFLHFISFVFRQNFRQNVRDSNLRSNCSCGARIVPSDHPNFNSHLLQFFNSFPGSFFDGICNRDDSDDFFFCRQNHGSLTLLLKARHLAFNFFDIQIQSFHHQLTGSDEICFAVDVSLHSTSSNRIEILNFFQIDILLVRMIADRFSQRMLGKFFQTCRNRQNFILIYGTD